MPKTTSGFDALMGKKIIILGVNYFYTGELTGNEADCIELTNPSIVYETGPWDDAVYKDIQKLPCAKFYVQKSAIESFGESK